MATAGTLIVRMMAQTEQFRKEMEESQKSLMKMSDAAAGMSVAVAAALAAAGTAAAAMALQVDDALDLIRIGTGETGIVLAGLQDSFRRVAERAPGELGRIATVIADLNTRLGMTGPILEGLAENVIHVNRMMGVDSIAIVRELGRVMGDWGIQTADASRTLDLMFAASQKTGIGLDRLGQIVVQYGAPLRQMGFSFAEAAALLAKWEREGVNAELILGSLRIALVKFAKAGMAPPEALKAITQQIKNAGSAAQANVLALEYFGARAGPDMAAAIREGRFETESLVAALQKSAGVVNQTAKDVYGLAESWVIFKNQLLLAFGPLAPVLDHFSGRIFPRLGAAVKRAAELWELAFRPEMRMAVIGFAGAIVGLLVPAFLKAAGAAILFVKANMLAIKSLALFAVKGAAVALAAYVIYRAWADAGGGMMAVGVLMVRMIGAVVGVLGVLIPSLRAVSQSIYAYADSLAAASRAARTAIQPAAVGMGNLQAASAQVGKSGHDAAKGLQEQGEAAENAAKAAGKNIMAFDQVHQLQEDMAGAGAAAAMAMAIPEMAMPDVTMPGLQVPDVAAVAGPLDELTKKWDAVTAAMERARPVLETIGYVMAAILIPNIIRLIGYLTLLAITSTIAAASKAAVWALAAAAAIRHIPAMISHILFAIKYYAILGLEALKTAAKVAAAWALKAAAAVVSLAAQLPVFAAIVAKWIWMAAVATAKAAKMAAAWIIAMGPVGWVILAIGLVAAAVALNWDKVSTWTKEKWGAVSTYLAETWDKIKNWASETWAGIGTTISGWVGTGIQWIRDKWTGFTTWLFETWNKIRTRASETWAGIGTAVETPIRTVITWIETQWKTISGTLGRIWEGIRTTATTTWGNILSAIKSKIEPLIGLINNLIETVNRLPLINIPTISPIAQQAQPAAAAAARAIHYSDYLAKSPNVALQQAQAAQPAAAAAAKAISPNVALQQAQAAYGAATTAAQKAAAAAAGQAARAQGATNAGAQAVWKAIPKLAMGGIVTNPTLAMIGEAGPEAVLPLRRGSPGVDAIADAIGQAVYAAVRDAIRVSRVEQGGQGQRQEVVLEIDGNKIGRAVLPTLIREGQRLGVQLAGV